MTTSELTESFGEVVLHTYDGVGYIRYNGCEYEIFLRQRCRGIREFRFVYNFDESEFDMYDISTGDLVWVESIAKVIREKIFIGVNAEDAEYITALQSYDTSDISKVNLPEFHELINSIDTTYGDNYPDSITDLLTKFHLETFTEEVEVDNFHGVSYGGYHHKIKVGSRIVVWVEYRYGCDLSHTMNVEARRRSHDMMSHGPVKTIKCCTQITDNLGFPVGDVISVRVEFQYGSSISIPLKLPVDLTIGNDSL